MGRRLKHVVSIEHSSEMMNILNHNILFMNLSGAGIATVALYDLQGRLVETLRATSLQGGTVSLNVKSVPAGVYVLRVTDADGKEYRQKVVRR